tara:strand:+ start:612 stop:812 length:201 start_codon:yes stop_codon:yes gene_type:complete
MTTRVFKIIPISYSGEVCGDTTFTQNAEKAAAAFFDGAMVYTADVAFKACGVVFSTSIEHLSVEKE